MTREQMIATTLGVLKKTIPQAYDERAAMLVDALHPELKPAPVKTPGAVIADQAIRWESDRNDLIWINGQLFPFMNASMMVPLLRKAFAKAFDAALAARDEQHRRELEGLRERCAQVAGEYPSGTANHVRAVPLTIEAKS